MLPVFMERSQQKAVISRRQMLSLLAFSPTAVLASCNGSEKSSSESSAEGRKISLGPIEKLSEGDTAFSMERVLLRKQGRGLSAMSLVCPHQHCLVNRTHQGFVCPCHGSRFEAQGKVTQGPSLENLPWYRVSLSPTGEVFVHLSEPVSADWRFEIPRS